MKLKYSVYILLLTTIISCNVEQKTDILELQKQTYKNAMQMNDWGTAANAAHQIVLLDTSALGYYDSLAAIYYHAANYPGASKAAMQALHSKSPSTKALEILAYSKFKTQQYEDAIINLQELIDVDKENELKYLYDLGVSFININNPQSAISYMDKIIDHPASKMTKKQFYIDNEITETYYYVAALNAKGYILMLDGDLSHAEDAFNEIFVIDPEFQLARENYSMLQELKSENPK